MAAKGTGLYVPIDFDVIDSPAFADLTGEALRLLVIVARQWNGKNNGHLQATFGFCKKRGIRSQTTLQTAIASLISHGFLVKTRGHGIDPANGKNIAARYAITWRPLCDKQYRSGIFVQGFVKNAYQKWRPEKNGGQFLERRSSRNWRIKHMNLQKVEQERVPITGDYEILAIISVVQILLPSEIGTRIARA